MKTTVIVYVKDEQIITLRVATIRAARVIAHILSSVLLVTSDK